MSGPAEPRLYGREAELALLDAALQRAVAGEQQLVLLEGGPGAGKSALLRGFARAQARRGRRGARLFHLQAPNAEVYRPVRHAAMAATSRRVYARLEGSRQATEVARSLLPGWISAIPVWGSLISAVVATADAMRRRRHSRAEGSTADEDVDALLAAARRRPLALLLDDLERADADAVARVSLLVERADAGARILVVGAYRPTAPGVADPPVHALRRTLPSRGELFLHHPLAGLSADAVAGWLGERFAGADVPPSLVEWLHDVTGGHPGEVHAALAELQRSGAVRRSGGRWRFDTDPERLSLGEVGHAAADLGTIPPEVGAVVEAASPLGDEFDAATLARLLGRDELAVEDDLALAVHCGLLHTVGERELAGGEVTTRYRFASTHLRAALARARSA